MYLLDTPIQCPHCWESQTLLVDPGEEHQRYIQDCQICCRPIAFELTLDEFGIKWLNVDEA